MSCRCAHKETLTVNCSSDKATEQLVKRCRANVVNKNAFLPSCCRFLFESICEYVVVPPACCYCGSRALPGVRCQILCVCVYLGVQKNTTHLYTISYWWVKKPKTLAGMILYQRVKLRSSNDEVTAVSIKLHQMKRCNLMQYCRSLVPPFSTQSMCWGWLSATRF